MSDTGIRVRLLGPITLDGGAEETLGPRLRRLLTALSLGRGMTVSESALIDAVWGDDGDLPANPGRSLQTYVSRLRGLLGADAVERTGSGYRLVADHVQLDITEFERQLEAARAARAQADDRTAVAAFEEALAMWAGDAIGEFADEDWAMPEARRLDELRIDAQEQRAELLIGLDDVDGALLADLERLAADHPHRDGPTRELMLALHRAGRQADALAAFARHKGQLATDLGLDPSAELVQIESQILTDDLTIAASGRGRPLRGYEIIERLGEGAFSIVYRGTQPSVDREVAIKQIRAELANQPDFIRRFDAEAHLVARLEHPNIVPLYDYWREPDSAYLVMRLLRGGSLETSLHGGRWDLEPAVQLIGQIGGALAAAHRAGVVHRDVKPANILLDDTGNAYLTDFGIALEADAAVDPVAGLSAGSPGYASPEQLQRQPTTPAADVHGLGIVLYEVLTGSLPFPNEATTAALLDRQLNDPVPSIRHTRTDVPAELDAVVARATAKEPTDRYPTVEAFVEAVEAAVRGEVTEVVRQGVITTVRLEDRNPYKGLRPFDEADAADFAGRSRLVDQLVASTEQSRLVAVVGPSGAGKSSVVRAGLLPALREGAVPGSRDWFVTTMLPGPAPFEELETALLRIAPQRPVDLLGVLSDGDRGIARGLRHAVPAEDSQVLLVIDQFEELFTLAEADVTRRFLDALAVALTEERPQVRVVLTLRADFYDRPLRHEAIGRLVRDSTIAVLPLAADELERAIVDPAEAVGVVFEPGLVSQIVADVADQPGALPMLQYALTELYDRNVSGLLTRTAYRKLGGVAGALGRRAEELYLDVSTDEQTATRRVFGRLVSLGEGTEDTRRRATRHELGEDDSVTTVVERFGVNRLLSFDRDPLSREPTVEVAHEALLREWPRLRDWLDEDRDGLRILRHLTATATGWDQDGRPPGELYRGGRLEAVEEWASTRATDLNPVESDFIEASAGAREADVEAAQRTTRRLRRLLTSVAVVAVLALIASAIAFQQQRSANRNADRAEAAQLDAEAAQASAEQQAFDTETERLITQATGLAEQNQRAAVLLALAAHQRDPSTATLGGLQQALIGSGPVLQRLGWGTPHLDVDWIPGDRLIATRADGLDLIDLRSGTVEDSIELAGAAQVEPSSKRTTVDSSGSLMAVLSEQPDQPADTPVSGVLSVYSIDHGFELRFSVPLTGSAANVSMSPSGELIVVSASASTESIVTAWSPDGDGAPLWDASYERPEGSTAYVSVTDGQVFVSNSGWLRRLDHAGEPLGPATTVGGLVSVGQDPPPPDQLFVSDVVETDTGWIAFGPGNASAVIDRDNGFPAALELRPLIFPTASRAPGAAAVVGDELLSARESAAIEWYDPATGDQTSIIELGTGINGALALSPRNDRYAVAHSLGVTVAALRAGGPLADAVPRDPLHQFLTISEDGTRTVHGSLDNDKAPTPEIWTRDDDGWTLDTDNPTEAWALEAMAMPDAPNVLFTRTNGLDEKAYRLDTYEQLWHWEDLGFWAGDDVTDVGPHGPLRAIKNSVRDHNIRVYELGQFEDGPVQTLEAPGSPAPGEDVWLTVRFDPAGDRLLVAGQEGDVELWDVESWTTIDDDFFARQDIAVATWNDEGSMVATASSDGIVSIRDGATFEVIREFAGAGTFSLLGSLSLSPDDSLLVNIYAAGQARLWDVATGEQIGIDFPNEPSLAYSNQDADGLRLITAAEEHSLVWNLEVDSWPDVACRVAGSNLTAEEWEQFGPRDTDRHAVCPDYPLVD